VHERSLAIALIRQIDEELCRHRLNGLVEVRLAIGEFAGVEPRLLVSAFEELAAGHWKQAPRLCCDIVPLTACCRACSKEFVVRQFRFECPDCGLRQVDVTAGEELQLISLKVEPSLC
jgi:hydrogenase nickel incorporation protein HypA/HybF